MLNNIIGGMTITLTNFFVWKKMIDYKFNFKNYKLYIGAILMTFLIILNYFSNNKIVSILLVILIYTLALKGVFKTAWKNALLISILTQFLYILSESATLIIVSIILNINKQAELINVFFGTVYANLVISFIVLLLGHMKFSKNLYNKLKGIVEKEKIIKVFCVVIILMLSYSLLFYSMYFKTNVTNLILICTILIVCCFVVVLRITAIQNNYLKMHVKYNNTLETLKSYEDIMDKYKVSNHENKNQLLMIRNMLGKDTKADVSKYIDEIVKNEYKDDEDLIMETSKIPSGGLRALIYSKLLYMKNNKINFELRVDRKIRNIEFSSIKQNCILDICKIIGVFLDNAIQECERTNDNSISVELYMIDGKLNISIANTFDGFIELDKIDEVKYTTKGEGHGYGLALVKEIINKNSLLENTRMINDNVFVQTLKISI